VIMYSLCSDDDFSDIAVKKSSLGLLHSSLIKPISCALTSHRTVCYTDTKMERLKNGQFMRYCVLHSRQIAAIDTIFCIFNLKIKHKKINITELFWGNVKDGENLF